MYTSDPGYVKNDSCKVEITSKHPRKTYCVQCKNKIFNSFIYHEEDHCIYKADHKCVWISNYVGVYNKFYFIIYNLISAVFALLCSFIQAKRTFLDNDVYKLIKNGGYIEKLNMLKLFLSVAFFCLSIAMCVYSCFLLYRGHCISSWFTHKDATELIRNGEMVVAKNEWGCVFRPNK